MEKTAPLSVAQPAVSLAPGARIAGRYDVVRLLGRGSFAQTFLANDIETGRSVALKAVYDRALADPKTFELFEREAAVLAGLRHRGVPELLAVLHADVGGARAGVLVMEYVEGVSIAQFIEKRAALEPVRVVDYLFGLLDVLDYLHTRVPPVLHRDIKPAHVIVRSDDAVALVDFGSVRNVYRQPEEDGSTIVGTYGYMPYEQYMGQASVASDLYAAGATFLHLVTGRPPSDFIGDEGRLETPSALPVGEPLAGVLRRLLQPAPARRFASAREARQALIGGSAVPVVATPQSVHPVELGTAPRDLARGTPAGDLFRRVAYGPWRLMNSAVTGATDMGIAGGALLAFFSVITVGVLPLTFYWISHVRRKRLVPFFREGIEGVATIATFKEDQTGFGEKLMRIGYDFEADGRNHRGSDQVHPAVADRLRVGDPIEILYLPDRGYDSVIIGGH